MSSPKRRAPPELPVQFQLSRLVEGCQEITSQLSHPYLAPAAPQNLFENEKRFRAAATTTADLIWEGNVRDNSLMWHGDIDSILGYDRGGFPRNISGHMDNIHPDDKEAAIRHIYFVLDTFHPDNKKERDPPAGLQAVQ